MAAAQRGRQCTQLLLSLLPSVPCGQLNKYNWCQSRSVAGFQPLNLHPTNLWTSCIHARLKPSVRCPCCSADKNFDRVKWVVAVFSKVKRLSNCSFFLFFLSLFSLQIVVCRMLEHMLIRILALRIVGTLIFFSLFFLFFFFWFWAGGRCSCRTDVSQTRDFVESLRTSEVAAGLGFLFSLWLKWRPGWCLAGERARSRSFRWARICVCFSASFVNWNIILDDKQSVFCTQGCLPWPPSSSTTSSSWLRGLRSGAASLALMNASFVACFPFAFVQTPHTRYSVMCHSLALAGLRPEHLSYWSPGELFLEAVRSLKLVTLAL